MLNPWIEKNCPEIAVDSEGSKAIPSKRRKGTEKQELVDTSDSETSISRKSPPAAVPKPKESKRKRIQVSIAADPKEVRIKVKAASELKKSRSTLDRQLSRSPRVTLNEIASPVDNSVDSGDTNCSFKSPTAREPRKEMVENSPKSSLLNSSRSKKKKLKNTLLRARELISLVKSRPRIFFSQIECNSAASFRMNSPATSTTT